MSEPADPKTDVSMSERGVWVSYNDDWSTMRIWRSEVPALRDAIKYKGNVLHCKFGLDPRNVGAGDAAEVSEDAP